MGIIKRGLLGGVSGKVANVVGGSWKGIAYLRALPLSVANPNTPAQQQQRGAFAECLLVAQMCLGNIIRPYWNQYAQKMSGFNLFQRTNIKAFDADGLNSPGDFTIGFGDLPSVVAAPGNFNVGTDQLPLTWSDNSGEGTAAKSDKMFYAAFNSTANKWYFGVTTDLREDNGGSVVLQGSSPSDEVDLWVSFVSTAGKTGRSSYYLVTL